MSSDAFLSLEPAPPSERTKVPSSRPIRLDGPPPLRARPNPFLADSLSEEAPPPPSQAITPLTPEASEPTILTREETMGDPTNGQATRQPPSPPRPNRQPPTAPVPLAQGGAAQAPTAPLPFAQGPATEDAGRQAKRNERRDLDLGPLPREAHREFRKGTWSRPLLLGTLAAGLLTALTLLSGQKPKEQAKTAARPLTAQPDPAFTIGSSQAPDRIADVPVTQTSVRSRKTDEPATRPSGIVPEKQFASEFKQRARQAE